MIGRPTHTVWYISALEGRRQLCLYCSQVFREVWVKSANDIMVAGLAVRIYNDLKHQVKTRSCAKQSCLSVWQQALQVSHPTPLGSVQMRTDAFFEPCKRKEGLK
jgi:hypothetical protein